MRRCFVAAIRAVLAGASFLLLAACASTLPARDMRFDQNSSQTLLVVTGQLQQVRAAYSMYTFRRVNIETRQFTGPAMQIGFSSADSNQGDELREVGERDKGRVLFASRMVEPGDYALVGLQEEGSGSRHPFASACYADSAQVFRLQAGSIAIVDAYRGSLMLFNRHLPPRVAADRIAPDFEGLRADFPNVRGTAAIVPPLANIQWAYSPTLVDHLTDTLALTDSCLRSESFSVRAAEQPASQ